METTQVGSGAATAAVVEVESATALLVTEARALVIADEAAARAAAEVLGRIAVARRNAEAQRVFWTKPLNDHVKAINEAFRAALAPLDGADREIRAAVLAWRQEEDRRHAEAERLAAEERRRIEDEARAAEKERLAAETEAAWAETAEDAAAALRSVEKAREATAAATAALLAPPPVVAPAPARVTRGADGTRTSTRKTWAFEVEDASLLPREYLLPDRTGILKAVQSGVRTIPGVRIFQTETLMVRN